MQSEVIGTVSKDDEVMGYETKPGLGFDWVAQRINFSGVRF